MDRITERIKNNPIKRYLTTILMITFFYIILLFIMFGTAYTPLCNQTSSILNITETSNIISTVYTPSSEQIINFEFIASIIVLIGGFGGFCYIFFSFCYGAISKNRTIYGFIGFFLIILITESFMIITLNFEITKYFEITELLLLIGLFFVTCKIISIAISVHDEFENNYENRNLIINFLTKDLSEPVISHFWDCISRKIFKNYEKITLTIFLLFFLIAYFGIIMEFNILSIVSIILFCLSILLFYSRLILMKTPSVNIELKKQNHSLISSVINHNPCETLKNVFILNDDGDFLKILKNIENRNEIIKISKYCICSIQDNDYEIYDEIISFSKAIQILKIAIYAILIILLSIVIYFSIGELFFTEQSEIILKLICFILSGICIAIIYLILKKIRDLFNRVFH